MRILKSFAFCSVVLLIFFSSCKSDIFVSEDALVYIPDNAASVTAFNMGRLMEKADFESVKSMDFYQDVVKEIKSENAAFAQVLEDPARAGIDLDQNVYLSMELDSREEPGLVTLLFSIKDKGAFERTLDDLDLQYVPATQEPGYLEEKSTALVWDDAVGILGISQVEQVRVRTAAYLDTDPNVSISRNKNLRKALAKDYDILNWLSSEAFVDLFQLEDAAKMGRFTQEDLNENYMHSSMHFEDGQMHAKTELFLQKKLSNDLALIFKNKVKTDFSKKVPHDNLFFFSNLAINPKGINQLLIEYHVQGMSDQALQGFGVSFDDLIKAFDGDGAIAMYQGKGKILKIPSVLMALKIDSRKHFDQILTAAQEAGFLRKLSENRYQMLNSNANENSDITEGEILIKDDLLYFTDREEMISQLESGNFSTNGELPEMMAALVAKNAFASVMDMQVMSKTEDDFEDIPIKTFKAAAGRNGGEASFQMINEKDNSLNQLFQWMEEQYQEQQEKKVRGDDRKS